MVPMMRTTDSPAKSDERQTRLFGVCKESADHQALMEQNSLLVSTELSCFNPKVKPCTVHIKSRDAIHKKHAVYLADDIINTWREFDTDDFKPACSSGHTFSLAH